MYFFKVVLSLFDEGKETIFIIPDTDTLGKDELPELFDSVLTAHPAFTAFVKRTKTSVVDVGYELYETKDVLEEISESDFELLQEQKMLKLLDSIDFCIQTRKIKQRKTKKGKSSSLFPIIGIGAAALILIAGAVYKMMRSKEEPPPEPESAITSDIAESSEGSESGLEELPIDDVISSVPEVVESTAEDPPESSEQDNEDQLPEDAEDSMAVPADSSQSSTGSVDPE